MANALFTSYKGTLLGAGTFVDIDADTIKTDLIDHGVVTPLPGTHDFYNDISTASVASSAAMTSKTNAGGVFDAADITYSAVSGASCESLVIWKDTTVTTTSDLMVFLDTATGLPVTPNGGDITVVWDSGANKIFALN